MGRNPRYSERLTTMTGPVTPTARCAVLSVACPRCGAGQREVCVSRTGRPVSDAHSARYGQAEKAGAFDAPEIAALRRIPSERVTVDKAALMAFMAEAEATRMQRDQEFVCGMAEQAASDAEFAALVEALDPR
jgi:hypothetical protein